ncbi:GntR family transcriptional regulator [Virgibacillus doumboii]|uniref:GntR family transcriptional regulator n=1 Tax=Virgibacillus doumboii TaxID=2697503 RepID=UPI0013DFABA2|nr:GntR family transcriptional regulator [Virgibacillus doumboii]
MDSIDIKVDKSSPFPYYQQIANDIREKVFNKEWETSFQLPSEEQLCKKLGVSRGTIRKSISSLIEEGVLMQVHGKGTFVKEQKISHRFGQELISFSESMERSGQDYKTKVLEKQYNIDINDDIRKRFSITSDHSKMMFLKRLRYINEEPVILIENIIDTTLCPGIEEVDFEKEALFKTIERLSHQKIKFGVRSFNATSLDSDKSKLLDLSSGTPILHLEQTTYLNRMIPVESSDVWLKSEKYPVTSYLHRS